MCLCQMFVLISRWFPHDFCYACACTELSHRSDRQMNCSTFNLVSSHSTSVQANLILRLKGPIKNDILTTIHSPTRRDTF